MHFPEELEPKTNSGVVGKETRQDVEPLNDEQSRELIETISREMYGANRKLR